MAETQTVKMILFVSYIKISEVKIKIVRKPPAFNTSNVQGWRVKLYELEPPAKGGSWVDRGTGYVRVVNSSAQFDSAGVYTETTYEAQASLLVLDETTVENILVNSPIKYNDAYERQGGMLTMFISHYVTIGILISIRNSNCREYNNVARM